MVTLPRDLLREVNAVAEELGESRSHLVRQALLDLIERIKQRRFEELLAEGYRESAEHAAQVAADLMPVQAVVAEGAGGWDE